MCWSFFLSPAQKNTHFWCNNDLSTVFPMAGNLKKKKLQHVAKFHFSGLQDATWKKFPRFSASPGLRFQACQRRKKVEISYGEICLEKQHCGGTFLASPKSGVTWWNCWLAPGTICEVMKVFLKSSFMSKEIEQKQILQACLTDSSMWHIYANYDISRVSNQQPWASLNIRHMQLRGSQTK